MWDGTNGNETPDDDYPISIHPSRVGWDMIFRSSMVSRKHFNPPIPCGMGRGWRDFRGGVEHISIHPSRVGWDAAYEAPLSTRYVISIHPSRVGWDYDYSKLRGRIVEFQSTHPVWDGTFTHGIFRRRWRHFNPPIPCGMGLRCSPRRLRLRHISIHPSRVGWDISCE